MPFNISDFRSTIAKNNGITKTTNFEVLVPNNVNPELDLITNDDLTFYATNVTMPGFQFEIDSVLHHGIGYPEQRPVGYSINQVDITFLVDQDQKVYQFFYEWLKKISNIDLTPRSSLPSESSVFSLPENYTDGDMTITQYSTIQGEEGKPKPIRRFTLIKAYPKTINSFDLAWNSTNTFQTILVEFEYKRWTTERLPTE